MDNQEIFEEAEKSAHQKIIEFTEQPEIQAQVSEAFYIWQDNPDMITDYKSEEDMDDETFTKFFDWFVHDFKLLDSQKRLLEKFFDENSVSLSDIEKQLVKGWEKSVNSIFEILEVESGDGCRIRDIFTDNIIYVSDVNASKKLSESDLISARPLKSGDKFYFSGLISAFPKVLKQKVLEYFSQEFDNYKKQHGSLKDINEFLKDWGYQLIHHIEDLLSHPQYLNPDGEEFVIAKAFYTIKNREKIISSARSQKEFREITNKSADLNVFIVNEDQSSFIEVDKNTLTLECNSEKRLYGIKEIIERSFKGSIEHTEDTIKPLDSFVQKDRQDQVIDLEVDTLDSYYDSWIVTPLERLDGLSPAEAMKDEDKKIELEAALFELERLYEDAKKHGEPYYDVKRIREKLKSV